MMGYFYWNPSPEMFHIDLPFLHRGILWYGFLFACGFFIGYSIYLYLLRRYFLFFPEFRKEDIWCAPELIRILRGLSSSSLLISLFSELPKSIKTRLLEWKVGDSVSEELKQEILKSCNAFIDSSAPSPMPRSRYSKKLLNFVKNRIVGKERVKKRLYMDETVTGIVSLKKRSLMVAEKTTLYVVAGALIGARLGDIFLYQGLSELIRNPLILFTIWEGGLASHGGAVGILIALGILSTKVHISFFRLLDLIVIPTALAGMFIRIGNFVNQEILGVPTEMPWGVIFGHPLGVEGAMIPRHPVQLYEAIWYGCVFVCLLRCFKKYPDLKIPGRIGGLFLILVFGFRFGIEFLKVEQSRLLDHSILTMGQILSVPMVIFGFWLLFRRRSVE